jgi:aryl-alcohol dehydrogenase
MVEAIAAVMPGANQAFSIQDITIDAPQPGEVLIDIKAVGVCHTDLVLVSGAFGTAFPAVLGHEGAGVVAAVGEGVTKVAVGDKVLLTFNSCGHCRQCEAHDPAYCESFTPMNMLCMREDGSTRLHSHGERLADNFFGQSSFASKAIANQRNVVKLSPDADLARLAPLGCGIQTGAGAVMRSLEAKSGQSLVVIGGGAVGLSAMLGGKISGCAPIIVIEPQEGRRQQALDLGADHVIDPNAGDLVEAVRAILPGGVDLVAETSGHSATTTIALGFMGTKAKLALVGVPGSLDAQLPLPVVQWITTGGTVRGVVEGDSDPDSFIPQLIAHHEAGRLPFDKFTQTYPFEQINQAIDDAHHGKATKVVLTFA